MIHFEQLHNTPYPGIGNDNDLAYHPNLRAGIMNGFVKELKCPVCGEQFHIYSLKHAWYIGWKTDGHRRYVCSYHCMREYERTKKTPQRGAKLDWSRSIETALERRKLCLQKIEHFEGLKEGLTGKANHRAGQNVSNWRHQLKDVELFLKEKGVKP